MLEENLRKMQTTPVTPAELQQAIELRINNGTIISSTVDQRHKCTSRATSEIALAFASSCGAFG
jgi:hypothetical protein